MHGPSAPWHVCSLLRAVDAHNPSTANQLMTVIHRSTVPPALPLENYGVNCYTYSAYAQSKL